MIHVFIGTKAQLIKMAPVMRLLQDRGLDYNFIYSGQHRDTVGDILDNFGIVRKPDVVLYEGKDITGIGQMVKWARDIAATWGKRSRREALFRNDDRGVVLNHGDTLSTLLGSWLARRHGLKSAHVESGLRSHNILHPFPEELIRLLTFRLSDYYFAPGAWALQNLQGYRGQAIDTVHNTLYDALQHAQELPPEAGSAPYGLVSIHRFENIFFRRTLTGIVDLLLDSDPALKKLFILHKPTEKKLREFGLYERLGASGHIELRPRYDYFRFMSLLRASEFLVSDGGSNQEECFYLGLPCLLMRKATERREGLGHNVVLSSYDRTTVMDFLGDYGRYRKPPQVLTVSPSGIIVDALRNHW